MVCKEQEESKLCKKQEKSKLCPDIRKICSWDGLIKAYNKHSKRKADKEHPERPDQWIFRGLDSSCHRLQTSLERALEDFGIDRDALRIEGGLLRHFKRECYHYITSPPEDDNIMEWLALMRHYEAPTRLLDWTYSFFVAVYFAVENASVKKSAVWALETNWMEGRVRCVLGYDWWRFKVDENVRERATFNRLFASNRKIVVAVTPYRRNDRLTAQRGTFLCPGDVSVGFEDNLEAFGPFGTGCKAKLVKYEIQGCRELKKGILRHLHHMNISNATLFPGLEGFAKSLKTLLAYKRILVPDLNWPGE